MDANKKSQHMMMHDEAGHQCTMMGDSMMMGESSMVSPAKKLIHDAEMKMFILPYLKDELQLSEDQISRLLKTKQDAVDKYFEADVAYSDLTDELETLAIKADVPTDVLEANLLKIARLQVQQNMDMYKAAAQMSSILSSDQMELFKGANPEELHKEMMSSMSMPEMMEMMKIMSCEEMDERDIGMLKNDPARQVIMGMMPGWMKMAQAKSAVDCECELHNTL